MYILILMILLIKGPRVYDAPNMYNKSIDKCIK